jgi:capsular polysaccharide biosynthesis protein
MPLTWYLNIVRRWLWVLLAGTSLAALLAFLVARGQPRLYEGRAMLLVNQVMPQGGSNLQDLNGFNRLAQTYARLIASPTVTDAALDALGMPPTEARGVVDAEAIRGTQFIELSVLHRDRETAIAIAGAVAAAASREIYRIELTRETRGDEYLRSRVAEARLAADNAAAEVARLDDRAAPARRAELTARLESDQATLAEARRALDTLSLTAARTANSVSPVGAATASTEPVRPRPVRSALTGAVLGLLAAGSVMVILEAVAWRRASTPSRPASTAPIPTDD